MTLWHILVRIFNHDTQQHSEIGQHPASIDHSPGDLDFIKFIRQKRAKTAS